MKNDEIKVIKTNILDFCYFSIKIYFNYRKLNFAKFKNILDNLIQFFIADMGIFREGSGVFNFFTRRFYQLFTKFCLIHN